MPTWTSWQSFVPSIVRRATRNAGVYEIALDGRRWRYVVGWSSTIYYGLSNSGIRGRLETHLGGRGNATVYDFLRSGEPLKVRWWSTVHDPRPIECRLLDRFEQQFGERPLGNIQGCAI
ncbi:MAG: hypothetical protein KC501_32280 [Myxococcales bacterium]|nr:hypothetical protein [Myxococcales bacterium]